jgi:hypothetical protein
MVLWHLWDIRKIYIYQGKWQMIKITLEIIICFKYSLLSIFHQLFYSVLLWRTDFDLLFDWSSSSASSSTEISTIKRLTSSNITSSLSFSIDSYSRLSAQFFISFIYLRSTWTLCILVNIKNVFNHLFICSCTECHSMVFHVQCISIIVKKYLF